MTLPSKLYKNFIQIINGVTEGYVFSEKQDVTTYTVFVANLLNENLIDQEEVLRLLFFLIDYNVKERKFKLSSEDNVNDNFRVSLTTAFLENVQERTFRDLKQRVFLVLFQLYVLSRSYISSHQEFQVIDAIRRLYPSLNIIKRNDTDKIAGVYRLLEVGFVDKERNPHELAQKLRLLEDNQTMQCLAILSLHPEEDDSNSTKISRKVEEIQERWRIENSEKMRNNFDYEFNLLASVFSPYLRRTYSKTTRTVCMPCQVRL